MRGNLGDLYARVGLVAFSECGGQTPPGIDRWADRRDTNPARPTALRSEVNAEAF